MQSVETDSARPQNKVNLSRSIPDFIPVEIISLQVILRVNEKGLIPPNV